MVHIGLDHAAFPAHRDQLARRAAAGKGQGQAVGLRLKRGAHHGRAHEHPAQGRRHDRRRPMDARSLVDDVPRLRKYGARGAVPCHNAYDSCHFRLFPSLLCGWTHFCVRRFQIRFSTKNAFSLSDAGTEKSVPPKMPQTAKPACTAARSMRDNAKQCCTATSSKRS